MQELVDGIIKSYGLVGLLIVAPYVALVILWKANQSLQKASAVIQELRIKEAQQISDKVMELVSEQASQGRETLLALDRVGGTLTIVQAALTGGQVAFLKEHFHARLPQADKDDTP